MKKIRLTEKDLMKIVQRIISEQDDSEMNRKDEKQLNLQQKLDSIFFGRDEMNISSEEGEFGYLSGEHRLSKKISPKQRMKRIQNVIDQLKDYISYLEYAKGSEESYVKNPDYGNVWKGFEED